MLRLKLIHVSKWGLTASAGIILIIPNVYTLIIHKNKKYIKTKYDIFKPGIVTLTVYVNQVINLQDKINPPSADAGIFQ